jgi:1,4-alpha-glucan branching enzyme
MYPKVSMSSPQIHSGREAARLAAKCLLILVAASLAATHLANATDPLGATLHKDGTTAFRVWAPFVDSVEVKINDRAPVPLAREPGHLDPADTTWIGVASGTKAGDQYRYVHPNRHRHA